MEGVICQITVVLLKISKYV